jgi:hypothetical protein
MLENNGEMMFFSENNNKEQEFFVSCASQDDYIQREFIQEIEMGINIEAYKQKVLIWNDTTDSRSRKKKRTPRGWIATMRQFMASDKSKGQLLTVKKEQEIINYHEL